jgi:hypothetical protein
LDFFFADLRLVDGYQRLSLTLNGILTVGGIFQLSKIYGLRSCRCILRALCVTLRENTEMPETLEVGSNTLEGTKPENILKAANKMCLIQRNWVNPFGDGKTGQTIKE